MTTTARPKLGTRVLGNSPSAIRSTSAAGTHLATLDGLRGLAALAVLVVHVFGEMHLHISSGDTPLEHLVPHVHLAVDFFFMLSGFVIAKAYESKLVNSMSFSQFMWIRLVRLYPLIFIGAALGTCSLTVRVLMTHSPSPGQLLTATLSALAILPTTALLTVFPGELFPIDFPQWSLFFELVINVIYAVILRWLSTVALIVICIASFVLLCGVAESSHRMLDIGMGIQPVGIIPADIWCGFIRVAFPFFFGVLLCRHRLSWRTGNATSVVLSLTFLGMLFAPAFRDSWAYEVMAVSVVFPIILSVGATCQNSPTLNKIFLYLGEISYPLYITHNPVTRILINAFNILHIRLVNTVATAICCLAAVLAAVVLLQVWDRPIRKRLSGLRRRRLLGKHSLLEQCIPAK